MLSSFAHIFTNGVHNLLHAKKPVAVVGHLRPDGDCIGSQVALCRVLIQMGLDAICFNQDSIPSSLKPFVADTPFHTPQTLTLKEHTLIAVDCADYSRLGTIAQSVNQPFLSIDHHRSHVPYAVHSILDVSSPATAYTLATIFKELNIQLDKTTAQALFLGICTDTGQFLYPSTTADVFKIGAYLVENGASPDYTHRMLFQQEPFSKILLLQHFLASFRLECQDRICIGILRPEDYTTTQALPEMSEGFVDFTRNLQSASIGIFLDIRLSGIKASLRAKEEKYRLDLFSKKFGGGGHACAAGFTIQEDFDTFYPKFIITLSEYIRSIS